MIRFTVVRLEYNYAIWDNKNNKYWKRPRTANPRTILYSGSDAQCKADQLNKSYEKLLQTLADKKLLKQTLKDMGLACNYFLGGK